MEGQAYQTRQLPRLLGADARRPERRRDGRAHAGCARELARLVCLALHLLRLSRRARSLVVRPLDGRGGASATVTAIETARLVLRPWREDDRAEIPRSRWCGTRSNGARGKRGIDLV